MSTILYTLLAVAFAAFVAWHRGYLRFGQCECGPEQAAEVLRKQVEQHEQPDPLDELAKNAKKLQELRKGKPGA